MTPLECKQIFALLSEYLDQELPQPMCDEIGAHIEDCPPCVEFVQTLRKTVEILKGHRIEVSPDPLPAEARAELLAAYQRFCGG